MKKCASIRVSSIQLAVCCAVLLACTAVVCMRTRKVVDAEQTTTIMAGETYVVEGEVVIESGECLSMQKGSFLVFKGGGLTVNGSIELDGCVVSAPENEGGVTGIRIVGLANISGAAFENIYVKPDTERPLGRVRYARMLVNDISGKGMALISGNTISMNSCEFKNISCVGRAVMYSTGQAMVSNCKFSDVVAETIVCALSIDASGLSAKECVIGSFAEAYSMCCLVACELSVEVADGCQAVYVIGGGSYIVKV